MAKRKNGKRPYVRRASTSEATATREPFDITTVKRPVTMRRSDPRAAAIEGDDPFPDGYVAADLVSGVDTDDSAEVGQRVLSHNERGARRAALKGKK
jgi:hypothetical protein